MADLPMSEAQLQAAVIDLAKLRKWTVYHTHDSRRSQPGFPDLVMARPESDRSGRVIFAELKSATGRISDAQQDWITTLGMCGAEVYFWFPAHLTSGEIDRVLR